MPDPRPCEVCKKQFQPPKRAGRPPTKCAACGGEGGPVELRADTLTPLAALDAATECGLTFGQWARANGYDAASRTYAEVSR